MKKKGSMIYVVICLLLCILPFAGMLVAPTNTTTENRTLSSMPEFSISYMQDLGEYFEEHFAFRSLLVTADSRIQSGIFGVSNMDSVIVGENGWLYYSATLDDYLGQNLLSDRACYNIAHNLSLVQQSVEERGAEFQFTIAPNKNTLYGEHMPYYDSKKVSEDSNADRVRVKLQECGVSYTNLFEAFENEEEVLYLKRDSHWNQKGAILAYHTILEDLGIEHETYEATEALRTRTEYGDLNQMIYPLGGEPEWNYQYQYETKYRYMTDTASVEDAWIGTENPDGNGSLLMFRDSFGNTLLPLMANTFETSYFSKELPYHLEDYMQQYHPQTVIVEKVERNMDDFASDPPIMTGPVVELDESADAIDTDTRFSVEESEYETDYWEIKGELDSDSVQENTRVYIRIQDEGETITYEAYTVSTESSDDGFLLYLPKTIMAADSVRIDVLTDTSEKILNVKSAEFCLNDGTWQERTNE